MPVLLRFIMAAIAKIFSKLFSLATVTFLGRVPSRDDSKISLIGVLSLYWLLVAVSLLSPASASVVIPLLPDDSIAITIAAAVLFIVIPLINGWLITKLQNYDRETTSIKKQLLWAYPYTLLLGLLIIALVIAVPIVKAPLFLKRYKVENLKVMIHPGMYEEALGEIENILTKHEMRIKVREPRKFMKSLLKIMVWVLERMFNRYIAKNMKIIEGRNRRQPFQITVHATDISIAGNRDTESEVMAILSEELDESFMYFTWDDESQKIEDKIGKLWETMKDGHPIKESEIVDLSADLRMLGLAKEDWNAIRLQIYRLESEFYRTKHPVLRAFKREG